MSKIFFIRGVQVMLYFDYPSNPQPIAFNKPLILYFCRLKNHQK